jgi:hypothetical protein
VPVLNAMLPGTAAAWTPSIDQCLETGSEYMWFIREVGEVGEPIGGWSEGMRFRVAAAGGTASNRREATNDAADQPPGGGRPGGPPRRADTFICSRRLRRVEPAFARHCRQPQSDARRSAKCL